MADGSSIHVALTLRERDEVNTAKSSLRLVPSTLECISDAAGAQNDGVPDALVLVAGIVERAVAAIDDVFAAADARRKGGAR